MPLSACSFIVTRNLNIFQNKKKMQRVGRDDVKYAFWKLVIKSQIMEMLNLFEKSTLKILIIKRNLRHTKYGKEEFQLILIKMIARFECKKEDK